MLALLVVAALGAEPALLKPVSLHAVTATSVVLDYEASEAVPLRLSLTGSQGAAVKVPEVSPAAHTTVTLPALSPNTRYRYELRVGASVAKGSFWTAPPPGAKVPFTFAVVGDSRDHGEWARVSAAILEKGPRFVLDTGDSVNRGDAEDWRDFYVAGQRLLAEVPFFSTRGNHDKANGFAAYNRAPPGLGTSAYAFDYGDARFVTFDSNAPDDEAQHAFVERALAAPSTGPKFVFQHHPLFSCGLHGSSLPLQTAFRPMFERAKVAADFAGHDHDLILWKPVGGVRYVVSGGGGTGTYPLMGCEGQPFAKQGYGFVIVRVEGARTTMTFFDAQGVELYAAGPDTSAP